MSPKLGSQRQRQAVDDLRSLAYQYPDEILAVGVEFLDDRRTLVVPVTLSMRGLKHPGTVLQLEDEESFLVGFTAAFPNQPPIVEVEHERWLGVVHILANAQWSKEGLRLCTYLDSDREWHPNLDVQGSIKRIWTFLDDVVNDRFDASTALFHPIGGLEIHNQGAATAVVRHELGKLDKNLAIGSARVRSEARVDIASRDELATRTLTISVPSPLWRGPGATLQTVLHRVEKAGGAKVGSAIEAVKRTASHNGPGAPLLITLAVARAASGAGDGHHLAVGKVDPQAASRLAGTDHDAARALSQPIPLEWLRTADQRAGTASRRDTTRPVQRLRGLRVELWGCGALGSWLAEFLVRAGVAEITVRDPAPVGPDLLVRQNYCEHDVGFAKAKRLHARLDAINDDLTVRSEVAVGQVSNLKNLAACDLLIDATVNEVVGARLNELAALETTRPLIAAVSTDLATASLGLVSVSSKSSNLGPAAIDQELHQNVLSVGHLEPFHSFWREPLPGEEIVAMRGCSAPTFHGSAADAAGMAAAMLNTISQHVGSKTSGLHLLAMPAAAYQGPGDTYLELGSPS